MVELLLDNGGESTIAATMGWVLFTGYSTDGPT